ncbi:MAG: iron-containing alcohol dehydrogenase [Bradymonadaceae bacterium]|nr:iron-containing alcohol dehydrogenase [Lujinxingiaceae bacterium]
MENRRFNFPTRIEFGPGVISKLAALLSEAGSARPLLLTDTGVSSQPFFLAIVASLKAAGLAPAVFDDGGGNPVKAQVLRGVQRYKDHGADAIVAIGGGAPMDVAKAVALMINHPGELFDYEDGKADALPVNQPIPYLIAVPTTAGTGSEVGRSAVISDDDTGAKKIIFDPSLLPIIALADPELTVGLPASVTATTGMDALSHNVEAFLSKGYHPMADGLALEGMRLIALNLRRAVEHPGDIEARGNMLMASLMGAVAFQKGLGITHSLAHPLSTVCDMHHGLANAIMIRYAMEFNAEAVPERFARMAQAVGAASADVEGFLSWLNALRADIGIPDKLSEAGVGIESLEHLVHFAWLDPCYASNPRQPSREDFEALYKKAL